MVGAGRLGSEEGEGESSGGVGRRGGNGTGINEGPGMRAGRTTLAT